MMARLGDLCKIQSGGTPSRSDKNYWENGTIPWVKISDIKNKYLNNVEEYITDEGLKNSAAKIFSAGTILYTIFATLGEVCILNIDATTNQAIAGIQIEANQIERDYLYYYLLSLKSKVNNIGRGVAQNNINMTILKNFEIPIPLLAEQRKIASVLDKVSDLISKRCKQLDKLDELVKARFVEMFGDPVINPMGWDMPRIEDTVAEGKNSLKAGPFGSSLKKEFYVESGYKIYGQEQVISGDAHFGDYYISKEKYHSLQSCAVQANDVLISLVGTYGKMLIIPDDYEPGIINPRLMKITFDKSKVNTTYFRYFFASESLMQKLADNTHGGTMDILNLGIVREIRIPLPPLRLQNNFAAFVHQTDTLKSTLKQSLSKLELLKKSLMQEYFG